MHSYFFRGKISKKKDRYVVLNKKNNTNKSWKSIDTPPAHKKNYKSNQLYGTLIVTFARTVAPIALSDCSFDGSCMCNLVQCNVGTQVYAGAWNVGMHGRMDYSLLGTVHARPVVRLRKLTTWWQPTDGTKPHIHARKSPWWHPQIIWPARWNSFIKTEKGRARTLRCYVAGVPVLEGQVNNVSQRPATAAVMDGPARWPLLCCCVAVSRQSGKWSRDASAHRCSCCTSAQAHLSSAVLILESCTHGNIIWL